MDGDIGGGGHGGARPGHRDRGLAAPTGTVTFSWFTNGTCTAPPVATSSPFALDAAGVVDGTTFTQTPLTGGTFAFQATFAGDPTYEPSTGPCEPLTVTPHASVTVTKSVAGIEPGAAWGPFTLAISPVPPGVVSPQTVSGTGTAPVSVTFAPLQTGTTYTVSEAAVPGWAAGPISCVATHTDDSTESFGPTFPVQAGDQVACAFTNTLQPGSLTIDKLVSSPPAPNADGPTRSPTTSPWATSAKARSPTR